MTVYARNTSPSEPSTSLKPMMAAYMSGLTERLRGEVDTYVDSMAERVVQLGGIEASTPAAAATGADVVITMLPDGAATESVMEGTDGAFATLADGGQIQMPLSKTFFSPMFGMVADRFGVGWMVLTLS